MTIENIQNQLKVIVNPNTGKTLHEEGRIVEVKADQNELLFKYKRDGITPEQKRAIETLVVNIAAPTYSADKVTVLTISENSADVFAGKTFTKPETKAAPAAAAAQIKLAMVQLDKIKNTLLVQKSYCRFFM